MSRILTLILLYIYSITLSATVKPRDGHYEPLVFADQVEQERISPRMKGPWKIGSQKNAPLKALGSPKVPVILVQFTDKKFISGLTDSNGNPHECELDEDELIVNEFYHKFCNGLGDGAYYTGADSHGAITEYFRDQSNGLFTPEFVVIGPVTLDNDYAYYGRDGGSKDTNLSQFYSDAIKKAQEIYTNWSNFDNNSDNVVDMAFFVYAGEGQNGCEDTNTIWPQERSSGGTINDTKYGCYACCNELYKGKTDGIGVFCHELSHAMGLPDFYDTNYVAYGMDYWDIMDSGCYCNSGYCPCNYTAYEREFMGWATITTLNPFQPQKLTLYPSSSFYLHDYEPAWQAYKMVNEENPNEYYVIENRQSKGWDLYVGRGDDTNKMNGMLITHVDYVASRWNNNTVNTNSNHQYMTIMPADGELYSYMYVHSQEEYLHFMYSTYGDLFPGYKKVTSFEGPDQSVYTTTGDFPEEMNQPLYNIKQQEDGTVTLHYMKRFKENQTLSITEIADMTYGDSILTLPETTKEGLVLTWTSSNTDVAVINGNKLTVTGAGTTTISASQEGDRNYEQLQQEFQLNVAKAQLTVTADSIFIYAGDSIPPLTVTYEGFLNGDDETSLTTQPVITCEADGSSPAGEYAIVLEGGESNKYELTLVNGILTINEPENIPGDVNEDGSIDISDIVAIISQIAGTATYRYADVNSDQNVDISDIVAVINIIAGQ